MAGSKKVLQDCIVNFRAVVQSQEQQAFSQSLWKLAQENCARVSAAGKPWEADRGKQYFFRRRLNIVNSRRRRPFSPPQGRN
jgi:hypothetical protein